LTVVGSGEGGSEVEVFEGGMEEERSKVGKVESREICFDDQFLKGVEGVDEG